MYSDFWIQVEIFQHLHVEAWSALTYPIYIYLFFLKVLVHGSAEATEHLKRHCLKHVCPHVYAPHIEETIDVTSDLCVYKVEVEKHLFSLWTSDFRNQNS